MINETLEADREYQKAIAEAKRQAIKSSDCIDRQAAQRLFGKALTYKEQIGKLTWTTSEVKQWLADCIEQLPPAQPEPISDAYMKAVWTWLIDYQIKAAELKGRYTPYEVLSWVANDWKKQHEHYQPDAK